MSRHVGTAEPAPQVALAPSALSPQTQDLEPAEDGLPPGQPRSRGQPSLPAPPRGVWGSLLLRSGGLGPDVQAGGV